MNTSSPVIRGIKRWLKRSRYEWFDRSHGLPLITKVIAMVGGAVIVLMFNYSKYTYQVFGVIAVIFMLTRIPGWIKNRRYMRQCEESGKGHEDEEWRLKQ